MKRLPLLAVCLLPLNGCLTAAVLDRASERFAPLARQQITSSWLEGDVRVVELAYGNGIHSRLQLYRLDPAPDGSPASADAVWAFAPDTLNTVGTIVGWPLVVVIVPFVATADVALFPLQPVFYFTLFGNSFSGGTFYAGKGNARSASGVTQRIEGPFLRSCRFNGD